jgi:hypothetical protein
MHKLTALLGCGAAVILVVAVATAEVSRPSKSCTAATNATAQTGVELSDSGILHKLEVVVSGTAKTSTVWVADSDGSLLTSNDFVSGSTLVSFTNNPVPVVGLVVTTAGANTNGITVTVKPTLEK